jgi:RNA helicase
LIYINGPSGIGKTYFANKVARAINKARGVYEPLIHNAPNHTRNTRYDFLSGYENEIVTVFDDLDAKTFDYAEFLNLFERDRVAKYSSRFRDKAWFAEVAIITKSEPIEKWTKKLCYSDLAAASSAEKDNVLYQPRRRFSLIVDLNTTSVKFQVYKVTDKKTNKHELHTIIDDIEFKDFHDEKTQSKIIKQILKLLNLEEVKDEDIEEVDEKRDEKLDELLKNTADLSKGVGVDG